MKLPDSVRNSLKKNKMSVCVMGNKSDIELPAFTHMSKLRQIKLFVQRCTHIKTHILQIVNLTVR